MDQNIQQILADVGVSRGEAFLQQIVLQLHRRIESDYTFIAQLNLETRISTTVALVANGKLAENFSYDLIHTPCELVSDNTVCCYPCGVVDTFPRDQLLIDMNIEGYLGTPLENSEGQVIGLIVSLYKRPISDPDPTLGLFELFAGRIAAELERQDYEQRLESLNQALDDKVRQRTEHLKQAVKDLERAQDKLVEAEKFAALGNLVAGVAHEVNTPIGVSVTAASTLNDQFKAFMASIDSGKLQRTELERFRNAASQGLELLQNNLFRASELIASFKETAADQQRSAIVETNIGEYYQKVLNTLNPIIKSKSIKVRLVSPGDILIETDPGLHAQILTNLVKNSALHGFSEHSADNEIAITLTREGQALNVEYQDNGKGLSSEVRQNIFQPFYTTARHQGGTGLGMSIVYNIVSRTLMGEVQLLKGSGFGILMTIPANIEQKT